MGAIEKNNQPKKNTKKKIPELSLTVWILSVLLVIGSAACSNKKKTETPANSQEMEKRGVPAEQIESRGAQEPEEELVQQSKETNQTDIENSVQRLENTFAALEDAIQRIPRETFDPEAIIQKAGSEPIKLFEWVRDETQLILYQGSLRGPIGVLMDRRGNSLDRALLLHKLLTLAGHEARLARLRLSEEQARSIFKKVELKSPGKASSLSPTSLQNQDELMALYVQNFGLDRKTLVETISKAQKDQENQALEVKSEYKELVEDILTLLSKQVKKSQGEKEKELAQDLLDHWWVQWERDGQWVDLDPTLPGSAPGQAPGEPEETLDPEELEESLFHSTKVSVIAEQFDEGSLKEKLVLQHTLVPSITLGKRIIVRHLPLNWPEDDKFLASQEPESFLKDAMARQTEWQATLEMDGKAVAKSFVTAAGNVSDKPSQKSKAKKGKPSGLGGLFGGLAGVEEEKEEEEKEKAEKPAEKSFLTALWLEFEINSPGQPRFAQRRQIFDLLGPAARKEKKLKGWKLTEAQRLERALKILGETEILPQVCALSPEFIEERIASFVLLHRDTYLKLVENYGQWEPEELFQEMTKIKPLPAELYGLALKRLSWSPLKEEFCLASPNLFARHSFLRTNEKGELVKTVILDIIANAVSPARKEGKDFFRVAVEQGILDTIVEASVMASEGGVENAASLFRQSKSLGINWRLVEGPEDPNGKRIQASADARASLEQALAGGSWAIVPEKEIVMAGKPRFAWWRLNPETGNLLGIGEKGAGQAMTEYAENVEIVLQMKTMLEFYGQLGRCLGAAITAPLRGNRPQHDELVIQCIWETICKYANDAAEMMLDIDVNWTNIIIKQTLDWALDSLCEAIWEKGIMK